MGWISRKLAPAGLFLQMVKFEHTLFGLPFVLMGAFLAARGVPSLRALVWMVLAAAGARNFAMALNRYADREQDLRNPRTRDREAFRGVLWGRTIWVLMAAFLALFLFSAYQLNRLAFFLSPWVALLVVVYSYSKRFTPLCHLLLGAVLGCAPAGGWVAVRGELSWTPLVLFLGVALWVAGFDIIYSCLDLKFDAEENLHSLPRRLGPGRALKLAAWMHGGTVACLLAVAWLEGLNGLYLGAVALAGGFLLLEHILVSPQDLSRVNLSFYNLNAAVSVVVAAGAVLDLFLPPLG
ncbi:MAG: UbiA-like polyprenyltransferase [Nitrospinota bacterium]